jgi:predicted tellurium resistance membrane protein TerC
MGTNKAIIKGIKYLVLYHLLFIGPSLIYNAFMNQQNVWHYLILAIGIVACLAVYLMYMGLKL